MGGQFLPTFLSCLLLPLLLAMALSLAQTGAAPAGTRRELPAISLGDPPGESQSPRELLARILSGAAGGSLGELPAETRSGPPAEPLTRPSWKLVSQGLYTVPERPMVLPKAQAEESRSHAKFPTDTQGRHESQAQTQGLPQDKTLRQRRAGTLSMPQPSQYVVSVLRTKEAVAAGRVPDPSLRRADGTPGTLLDGVLPELRNEEARREHRRRLDRSASWRFMGANIRFLSGPTLAALNASFYRYSSVAAAAALDWRKTMFLTPIQAQYDCSSCWATAAADAVAIANAIASNTPPVAASVQQICDCSGLGCCQGGWPEDAFSWMTSQGNVTTATNYPYWATDGRTCSLQPRYPLAGNISGWERVPLQSLLDLAKAVNMQPVLVYISASSTDFQTYSSTAPGTSGFRIYDGNCTAEVNHAVLVVGYDTTGPVWYWILKNTWLPTGWGDNGYMYIAMYDGPGKCGMQMVHPIYPVYFPNAPVQVTVQPGNTYPVMARNDFWWNWWNGAGDPCRGIVNPCGSGQCIRDSNGIARCLCYSPYVEVVGVPTSKCVDPSPCTNSFFNPCGAGWCEDVGDGSYICGCPAGYAIGTRVNGGPTCVPVSSLNVRSRVYITQYGDTCASVQAAFNLTAALFASLNPYVLCYRYLAPGLALALSPASTVICTQQYAVRPGDTCSEIAYYMDRVSNFRSWLNPSYWSQYTYAPSLWSTVPVLNGPTSSYSPASLLAINPALNCSSLLQSQLVCVTGTNTNTTGAPVLCGQTYTTVSGDSCSSVQYQYGLSSSTFARLNPGISCLYYFWAGMQLCVAPAATNVTVNCTQWYTVQQGDTCAQIWNAANMSQFQLLYINPGLQCNTPFLYVGLQVCINSPLLENIPDPNYLLYTTQPNDTWSYIQAQFTTKCQAYSITINRIASQNNISDWVNYSINPGIALIIPCIPRVGSPCGCVASTPVCGANLVNYNSYCDARCNFATPPAALAPCSSCFLACSGRYGQRPVPTTACPGTYVCPWPIWPPPASDVSAVFGTNNPVPSPVCSYRVLTCTRACVLYNSVNKLSSLDTACYTSCMACQRVPCSGPSQAVLAGVSPCLSCPADPNLATAGCTNATSTTCTTDCSYWNARWNPLNP